MKTTTVNIFGGCCTLAVMTMSAGCDPTLKPALLEQLVSLASSITSAAITSLIQSALGTVGA